MQPLPVNKSPLTPPPHASSYFLLSGPSTCLVIQCSIKTESLLTWGGEGGDRTSLPGITETHTQYQIPNTWHHGTSWVLMMHHEYPWWIMSEYSWCVMSTHGAWWVLMMHHEYSWIVHGLSMDYPWIVHGLSMDSPWIVHGSSMAAPWMIQGLYMDSPWIIHGLSSDYPADLCPRIHFLICRTTFS